MTLDREGLRTTTVAKIIAEMEFSGNEISTDRNIRVIIPTGKYTFCVGTGTGQKALTGDSSCVSK